MKVWSCYENLMKMLKTNFIGYTDLWIGNESLVMLWKSYETYFIGYWILWNWPNIFHRQREMLWNEMSWEVITAKTKEGHFETRSHINPLKLKLALVKPEMTSPKFQSTACQGSFQHTVTKEDHFGHIGVHERLTDREEISGNSCPRAGITQPKIEQSNRRETLRRSTLKRSAGHSDGSWALVLGHMMSRPRTGVGARSTNFQTVIACLKTGH